MYYILCVLCITEYEPILSLEQKTLLKIWIEWKIVCNTFLDWISYRDKSFCCEYAIMNCESEFYIYLIVNPEETLDWKMPTAMFSLMQCRVVLISMWIRHWFSTLTWMCCIVRVLAFLSKSIWLWSGNNSSKKMDGILHIHAV